MSTTTNFKRIALVAVAALGMGVLSSAPSQAAFSGIAGSQLTVTAAAGTGSLLNSRSDSTTAATVTISGLALAALDSYTVTSSIKTVPGGATIADAPSLLFMTRDTTTSTGATFILGSTNIGSTFNDITRSGGASASAGTRTAGFGVTESSTTVSATAGAANTYTNATFFAYQESTTVGGKTRLAGVYTYTLIVTPQTVAAGAGTAQIVDVTITIAALASASITVNPGLSTAFVGSAVGATADAALSMLATSSDTARGYVTVKLRNADNAAAARESVTITTTIGQVGTATNRGRSVVLAYTGDTDYNIYSDGTSGTGTITVSTPSVTFAAKTISFYAVAAKTLAATVAHPLLKVGANVGAVRVTGPDASGVNWAGTAYIYASSAADALVAGSVTPSACSWSATDQRHNCDVTGTTAGTAKFKIIDAATVALATATSNEVTVTVSTAAVAKVALSFDKASYVPNERMRIYVTAQDATGASLPAATFANMFATGGITSTAGFSGAAVDISGVSVTTSAASSSVTAVKAGALMYTVFAPASGGTVTISAIGGISLPVAAQVAVSASATVTDSGAAALAAVTALATTVASLKTLITTLTNLVLKIQKKVKA